MREMWSVSPSCCQKELWWSQRRTKHKKRLFVLFFSFFFSEWEFLTFQFKPFRQKQTIGSAAGCMVIDWKCPRNMKEALGLMIYSGNKSHKTQLENDSIFLHQPTTHAPPYRPPFRNSDPSSFVF